MPKKIERGDPLGFSNIHSVAKQQKKLKGGPFEEKKIFRKKSLAVPKKIGRGDPLVSPGMVWYAGKQEKPFWFSSLDQIVHFGPIIFCRTFKNYFGQFVWIEKKEKKRKVTIIVAFHFMKRRLKNMAKLLVNFSFQSQIVLGVQYQGDGNFKAIIYGSNRKRSLCGRQKMKSHITESCYWSLNLLTEVEEPAGMGESLGTGAHRHRSILPPGVKHVPRPWVLRQILSNRS